MADQVLTILHCEMEEWVHTIGRQRDDWRNLAGKLEARNTALFDQSVRMSGRYNRAANEAGRLQDVTHNLLQVLANVFHAHPEAAQEWSAVVDNIVDPQDGLEAIEEIEIDSEATESE